MNHSKCRPDSDSAILRMQPRLLVDVGEQGHSDTVFLCETAHILMPNGTTDLKYTAVSHMWNAIAGFSGTVTANFEQRKRQIIVNDLPETMKDAIKVTRELGIRYLWIDTLCVINDNIDFFEAEVKNIPTIFNLAYCVIAASHARSDNDGFLIDRREREFVSFTSTQGPFYVCEAIDNFQSDVIGGNLNRQGWILQERAFARRTISFTTTQTYWECGEGVRCETLTKQRK